MNKKCALVIYYNYLYNVYYGTKIFTVLYLEYLQYQPRTYYRFKDNYQILKARYFLKINSITQIISSNRTSNSINQSQSN